MSTTTPKSDYGFDAPTAVRNFILIGSGLIGVGLLLQRGIFALPVSFLNASSFLSAGVCLAISGFWMIIGSRVLKFRARDKLLDALKLKGDEKTLDVGCGRGLLLIGTARRLTTGEATGVDIWQTVDQSGNDPRVTLGNAEAEGVTDKVKVVTGDARKLPFADASFDAITSSWAIHNIPSRAERDRALSELIRVLRPGGRIALLDIQYFYQYRQFFRTRPEVAFEMRGPDLTFLTPSYLFLVRKK